MRKGWHSKMRALWQCRQETAIEASGKLARMITELGSIHSSYRGWKQQAHSKKRAQETFCSDSPSPSDLLHYFVPKGIRSSVERESYIGRADVGWIFSTWNGQPDESVSRLIWSVGVYSDPKEHVWVNFVELAIPSISKASPGMTRFDAVMSALKAMIDAWNPDLCILEPDGYSSKLLERGEWHYPQGGWIGYVANSLKSRLVNPLPFEPYMDGAFMMATREQFNLENPEHLAAADRMHSSLALFASIS